MHQRLAHTNEGAIKRMLNEKVLSGINKLSENSDADTTCASCSEGKMKKTSHPRRDKKKRDNVELDHSDLSGKISPVSYKGNKYVQLLVDDASGAIWANTTKQKSDAKQVTQKLIVKAQVKCKKKVTSLRTHGAKELRPEEFLLQNETDSQDTPPYSPESNARVERANRTI